MGIKGKKGLTDKVDHLRKKLFFLSYLITTVSKLNVTKYPLSNLAHHCTVDDGFDAHHCVIELTKRHLTTE